MSKVFKRGPKTPEMNMTPLIDVTFLLIVFFMLVTNIVSEETEKMLVPDLADPKTQKLGEVERIVINVTPFPFTPSDRSRNPLNHSGEAAYVKIGTLNENFPIDQLEGVTFALEQEVATAPKDADGNSLLEVVLRADMALYYSEVQPVMAAITAAGIAKVNLVALLPEDER